MKTHSDGWKIRRRTAVVLGVLLLSLVVGVVVASAQAQGQGRVPPPPTYDDGSSPEDDGNCDFGRHPQTLWFDNPSGHPFERYFCTCPGGDVVCDPLDTQENNLLYCDEVPDCWAYGL